MFNFRTKWIFPWFTLVLIHDTVDFISGVRVLCSTLYAALEDLKRSVCVPGNILFSISPLYSILRFSLLSSISFINSLLWPLNKQKWTIFFLPRNNLIRAEFSRSLFLGIPPPHHPPIPYRKIPKRKSMKFYKSCSKPNFLNHFIV